METKTARTVFSVVRTSRRINYSGAENENKGVNRPLREKTRRTFKVKRLKRIRGSYDFDYLGKGSGTLSDRDRE